MKRTDCTDPFLRGYIDAALFTTDPYPPSGSDYVESGRADEMWPSLPDWWLKEAQTACAAFEEANAPLLALAGSYEQNGNDFCYTRNHHGVGFWDRGYDDEIANPLTDAAHKCGEHYLMAEDFGMETA